MKSHKIKIQQILSKTKRKYPNWCQWVFQGRNVKLPSKLRLITQKEQFSTFSMGFLLIQVEQVNKAKAILHKESLDYYLN